MKNKKGQMEIMGLAIVIMLLIVGMLFVVRFVITKEPEGYKKEFTQSQLASNMLNTLLKTNTDCPDLTITELLQDCGHNPDNPAITCSNNGKKSCQFVEDTAKYIFNQTLDEWNINYHFTVYFEEDNPIIELGSTCPNDQKTEIFPIPSYTTLFTRLDICG
ncbi:hypothetical protein GOV14_04685 [Candidatus Pacearchaeota archaeon]|nr:hypothetical protein [Candidatus Pacearchaeota archaeon]